MEEKTHFLPPWAIRIGALVVILLLVALGWKYSNIIRNEKGTTILQGEISIMPLKPLTEAGKVQPGTPVKLRVVVENKGNKPSQPGEVYIQYAFPTPLDKQPKSIIFQTEKMSLPVIQAQEKAEIDFTTPHQLPSIFDFVREDWLMREYQAIAKIGDDEKTIGTLAITFSGYYYPGVQQEFPSEFNALSIVEAENFKQQQKQNPTEPK